MSFIHPVCDIKLPDTCEQLENLCVKSLTHCTRELCLTSQSPTSPNGAMRFFLLEQIAPSGSVGIY